MLLIAPGAVEAATLTLKLIVPDWPGATLLISAVTVPAVDTP